MPTRRTEPRVDPCALGDRRLEGPSVAATWPAPPGRRDSVRQHCERAGAIGRAPSARAQRATVLPRDRGRPMPSGPRRDDLARVAGQTTPRPRQPPAKSCPPFELTGHRPVPNAARWLRSTPSAPMPRPPRSPRVLPSSNRRPAYQNRAMMTSLWYGGNPLTTRIVLRVRRLPLGEHCDANRDAPEADVNLPARRPRQPPRPRCRRPHRPTSRELRSCCQGGDRQR